MSHRIKFLDRFRSFLLLGLSLLAIGCTGDDEPMDTDGGVPPAPLKIKVARANGPAQLPVADVPVSIANTQGEEVDLVTTDSQGTAEAEIGDDYTATVILPASTVRNERQIHTYYGLRPGMELLVPYDAVSDEAEVNLVVHVTTPAPIAGAVYAPKVGSCLLAARSSLTNANPLPRRCMNDDGTVTGVVYAQYPASGPIYFSVFNRVPVSAGAATVSVGSWTPLNEPSAFNHQTISVRDASNDIASFDIGFSTVTQAVPFAATRLSSGTSTLRGVTGFRTATFAAFDSERDRVDVFARWPQQGAIGRTQRLITEGPASTGDTQVNISLATQDDVGTGLMTPFEWVSAADLSDLSRPRVSWRDADSGAVQADIVVSRVKWSDVQLGQIRHWVAFAPATVREVKLPRLDSLPGIEELLPKSTSIVFPPEVERIDASWIPGYEAALRENAFNLIQYHGDARLPATGNPTLRVSSVQRN